MFRYVRGDSSGVGRLVDDARGVEFRNIRGARAYSTEMAALLTWGDRQIPLQYGNVIRTDASTGRMYGLFGFTLFGESSTVRKVAGIGPYSFSSDEERDAARLLAIEALLVQMYKFVKGEWDVEGNRVISEGREWKASDFGYHSSTDISPGIL